MNTKALAPSRQSESKNKTKVVGRGKLNLSSFIEVAEPVDSASAFDRKGQYEIRRRALLNEAARMLSESEGGKFSLSDVASNLNITKTAFYYYFKSKQEILYECYAMSFDVADRSLDYAVFKGRNAAESLELFVYNYALNGFQELYSTMSLRVTTGEVLLPEYKKRVDERRSALHKRLRAVFDEGIAEGSIKPCNPVFAVAAILGGIAELLKIFNPSGEFSADELAREASLLMSRGFANGGRALKLSAEKITSPRW